MNTSLSAGELVRELESFLLAHPYALVVEDGRTLFDMREAQFSLTGEHGRCALQLWSAERNLVRTVTGIDLRKDALRLQVQRFGQSTPQLLHLLAGRELRSPGARENGRAHFLRVMERVLRDTFEDCKLLSLGSSPDLQHSFGPAFARGVLVRGAQAWAVVGVGPEEPQTTVDGVLTVGLLWLDLCRARGGSRRHFAGLRILVPEGMGELTATRMAWLDPARARWELYELDRGGERLAAVEIGRSGNTRARLQRAFDPAAAVARLELALGRLRAWLPAEYWARTTLQAKSPGEVAATLHGLEFARVRHRLAQGSLAREDHITFGAGARETELTEETAPQLHAMVEKLFESRHPGGSVCDPLFRLQGERWLESLLRAELGAMDPQLRSECVYSQIPAMASRDRGMLDLLSVSKAGRLTVLELKVDEDMHMPLQGLDYWIRVRQLHAERDPGGLRGAFERHGYFPGLELSPLPPTLCFVAPALRIHPSTETVLRYLSPEVEWQLIALNESWRSERIVVFRKHSGDRARRSGSPLEPFASQANEAAMAAPSQAACPRPAARSPELSTSPASG